MTATPEQIYERSIDPASCCDIGLHLPFMRSQAHGNVVEIGVRGGSSTSALILGLRAAGGHLWSIDMNPACRDIFEPTPPTEWTFIHGHSVRDFPAILLKLPEYIDLLFIDADHSYDATLRELRSFGVLVRPGGMILMHDTELDGAGVLKAGTEYAAEKSRRFYSRPGCYGLGVIRV